MNQPGMSPPKPDDLYGFGAPQNEQPAQVTTNTARCSYCGKELRADAAFCDGCGHSLTGHTAAPAYERTCSRCGKPIATGYLCPAFASLKSTPTREPEMNYGAFFLMLISAILWFFAPWFGSGRYTYTAWDYVTEYLDASRVPTETTIFFLLIVAGIVSIAACLILTCTKNFRHAHTAAVVAFLMQIAFLVFAILVATDYFDNMPDLDVLVEGIWEVLGWGYWVVLVLTGIAMPIAKSDE